LIASRRASISARNSCARVAFRAVTSCSCAPTGSPDAARYRAATSAASHFTASVGAFAATHPALRAASKVPPAAAILCTALRAAPSQMPRPTRQAVLRSVASTSDTSPPTSPSVAARSTRRARLRLSGLAPATSAAAVALSRNLTPPAVGHVCARRTCRSPPRSSSATASGTGSPQAIVVSASPISDAR
jgi:hypothetical protein